MTAVSMIHFHAKPKGMHWRTYEKLERQCEILDEHVAAQFMFLLARF
jgi:hypothetical protein